MGDRSRLAAAHRELADTIEHVDALRAELATIKSRLHGLNFGQALIALKRGHRVARAGWNGKGMFIYLVEGATVPFENLRGAAQAAAVRATELENGVQGSSRRISSHIDMKAADGSLTIGWAPSQVDMLAEDWELEQ